MRSYLTAVAALSLSLSSAAQAHPKKRECVDISAQQVARAVVQGCDSPIGLCTEGTLYGKNGKVIGHTRFTALSAASSAGMPTAEPATSLSYVGQLVVTTREGTFTFTDLGIFDMAANVFTEMARAPEGNLFISGTTSDGGLTFNGSVSGRYCGGMRN